ncbi:MAG: hypothetical protein ABR520_04610 [Mycobacteriales bacterium]|nr:hypothetical protein [Frankia sp.]
MKKAVVIVTALAATSISALAAMPASSAASKITFGVPRIVDPIHLYGEPDIKVSPRDGAIHVSGPQGTGVQRSIWNVSVDDGDSYRIVQDIPGGTVTDATYVTGLLPTKSSWGAGGGDTEISIARNGKVFYNDLYALTCFTAATTNDNGKTVESNPIGCANPVGDRQWFGIFEPRPSDKTISPYKGPVPVNYHEYAAQIYNRVEMSPDGLDYSHQAGMYNEDGSGYTNTQANIVVDQHTGDVLSLSKHVGNSLALAVGVPQDAAGNLKFHYNKIADALPGDPSTLFPIITQDTARNLYAVWVDGHTYQTWYSWSKPNKAGTDWTSWSAPKQVNKAPARTNLMPWAVAGAPGMLDIVWYGTEKSLKELGADGPSAKVNQMWDVWFAQLDKANTKKPNINQVKATPHPMHYGDICMQGTACIASAGNRNTADFFQVTLDRQGRARIVYNDTSNGLSQSTQDSPADHTGAALVSVLTQSTGLNLWTGKPLKARETQAPVRGVGDRPGDALFKPLGGTKVPSADIRNVELRLTDTGLSITVRTKEGNLGDAATAAVMPFGQLVVRWQMGNTLFHAGVEQPAGGAQSNFFAGETLPVDLCSVSGCKPNYFDYFGTPGSASGEVTSSAGGGTTYKINVPLSAIGNPSPESLLEEVMAFVAVSPKSASVPMNNAQAFADEVPLQLEGTKTFNFRGNAGSRPQSGAVLPVALTGIVLTGAAVRRSRAA